MLNAILSIFSGINILLSWLIFLLISIIYILYVIATFDRQPLGRGLFNFIQELIGDVDIDILNIVEICAYIILVIVNLYMLYFSFKGLPLSNGNRYLISISILFVIISTFFLQGKAYIQSGKYKAITIGLIALFSPLIFSIGGFIFFRILDIIFSKWYLSLFTIILVIYIIYNVKFRPNGKTSQIVYIISNKISFSQMAESIKMLIPAKRAEISLSSYLQEHGFKDRDALKAFLKRKNINLDDNQFEEVMVELQNKGLISSSNNGKAWKWIGD